MRDQGETKIKQPGGLFYRSFSAQSREKRKQSCALRAGRLDLAVGSAVFKRVGVLADHVAAVPDVIADGGSMGKRRWYKIKRITVNTVILLGEICRDQTISIGRNLEKIL